MGTRFEYVYPTPSINCLSLVAHQTIEGLETLVNLEELWLGKNKITRLEVSCLPAVSSGYT